MFYESISSCFKESQLMMKWWHMLNKTMLKKQFKFVRFKFPHFFLLSFFLSLPCILLCFFCCFFFFIFVKNSFRCLCWYGFHFCHIYATIVGHPYQWWKKREEENNNGILIKRYNNRKHSHKIDKHKPHSHFRLRFLYLYLYRSSLNYFIGILPQFFFVANGMTSKWKWNIPDEQELEHTHTRTLKISIDWMKRPGWYVRSMHACKNGYFTINLNHIVSPLHKWFPITGKSFALLHTTASSHIPHSSFRHIIIHPHFLFKSNHVLHNLFAIETQWHRMPDSN